MRAALPAPIRRKMVEARRLEKNDIVTWQRILNAKGWAVPHWPAAWAAPAEPGEAVTFSTRSCSRRRRPIRCRSASYGGPVIIAFAVKPRSGAVCRASPI